MISEPSNYYDLQVIALDLSRLYNREKALLADMVARQQSASSMAEQLQIHKDYQKHDDVINFSSRKAEILRRQKVALGRIEAEKNKI